MEMEARGCFIFMKRVLQEIIRRIKAGVSDPIYNIAGDQDPVGQYGTGVYQCANWLADSGHHVDTVLYTGYRHEIHNYADLKEDVEDGIIEFFDN